ncbi:MAG: bifunctional glutamate N-acetyltransferase/amino-acid acetyltransferase ArgJ [Gammaproteobacteria bacterium]|nr:bifunctional glutamate N-acetyltransferase/amino-acid acetyltransferase ArgJ [Gammaproteobacteria bacterium]
MSIGLPETPDLAPVKGIRLACASAGLYRQQRDDLLLIEVPENSTSAAVFTRNRFAAAPVTVARTHLETHSPRYCLVNAGNANAGTGQSGIDAALECCKAVSENGQCNIEEVLPFSTGVIGENLPVDRIRAVLPECFRGLSADGWQAGARAIMTTDTTPKGISRRMEIDGQKFTVTGIAKGSGMIRPDMATMLAFIATDAVVDQDFLGNTLQESVGKSFNRITVDGDTSTNDAVIMIATGQGPVTLDENDKKSREVFRQAVNEVCQYLAQAIVRDGEGATKFVTVRVEGGSSGNECLQVAYAIAHSPLVKTALFASDPNWGRILAAIGRAGIDDLDIGKVQIRLNDVCIVENGAKAASYTEEQGQAAMRPREIVIRVVLGRGDRVEQVWTTDLSYDYVKINAEYRT